MNAVCDEVERLVVVVFVCLKSRYRWVEIAVLGFIRTRILISLSSQKSKDLKLSVGRDETGSNSFEAALFTTEAELDDEPVQRG